MRDAALEMHPRSLSFPNRVTISCKCGKFVNIGTYAQKPSRTSALHSKIFGYK